MVFECWNDILERKNKIVECWIDILECRNHILECINYT